VSILKQGHLKLPSSKAAGHGSRESTLSFPLRACVRCIVLYSVPCGGSLGVHLRCWVCVHSAFCQALFRRSNTLRSKPIFLNLFYSVVRCSHSHHPPSPLRLPSSILSCHNSTFLNVASAHNSQQTFLPSAARTAAANCK
jgi:hypothetical protein